MIIRLCLFSLSFFSLSQIDALPIQNSSLEKLNDLPIEHSSLEELNDLTDEEIEMAQEAFFGEEEEISVLPKKGNRPQVIQIPTKTSLPQ